MYYQLHALRWQDFEDLVVQICHKLLGLGTLQFSTGADGGRDAYFEGTAARYPSSQEPWSGKLVIQAKHTEKADASCSDADFVRTVLTGAKDRKSEAEKIATLRREGKCDGYLMFTNRGLPALQADKLVYELRKSTGVEQVAILGKETISSYLDESPEIARRFNLQKDLIPAARFQIPPPKRDFTGREQELAELRDSVRKQGGAMIYGMRGLGGVGKTELALKLAEEVGAEYPDGHLWVQLGGASDRSLSPAEALAQAIRAFKPQAQLPDSVAQLQQIYRTVLRDRRVLLLLDDAASAEQVEPLLPHAECLTIVTSRYRFSLPKLHRQDLDALTEEAARDLLLSLAPRLGAAAEELAQLLGRLPLALRLAGSAFAEQPGLHAADYIQRFAERKECLDEVERAITFNYERLTEEQRHQWRLLAVFSGGFDVAAAAAVWGVEIIEAQPILDCSLYRVSLVENRAGRYRLQDLARDSAAARLRVEEQRTIAQKHARHYLEVLTKADRAYLEGDEMTLEGLALFDQEWGNIRAGQSWAAANVDDNPNAAELCSAYPAAGLYCLHLRLNPHVWIVWMETGRSAAVAVGDRRREARYLGNLGTAYLARGEPRLALDYNEQALKIYKETGDRRGEGYALVGQGVAYRGLGEARRAIEFFERSLDLWREVSDQRGEGEALGHLGAAYLALDEPRQAIGYFEQALEVHRNIGDRRHEGHALGSLGSSYAMLSKPRRAIGYYKQALEIHRAIGDQRGEALDLWHLGIQLEKREPKQAAELMQRRVDYEREIDHPDSEKHAVRVEEIRARLSDD